MPQGRRRLLWLRRISSTHTPYRYLSAEKTKKGVKKHDSTTERYPVIQHLGRILDNRLPLILTLALIEMDIQLMKDTLVG
jgi:hypothetical protein